MNNKNNEKKTTVVVKKTQENANEKAPQVSNSKNHHNKSTSRAPQSNKAAVWWKNFKNDVCCPITLTPINLLPSPPFEIVDPSSKVRHLFDASALADYILSTQNFINPVNREPLNRETCTRLDLHLISIGKRNKAKIVEALEIQAKLMNQVQDQAENPQRVRDAGVMLHQLFHFSSNRMNQNQASRRAVERTQNEHSNNNSSRNERMGISTERRGAQIIDDDDDWETIPPHILNETISVTPQIEEEFPSLSQPSGTKSKANVPPPPDVPMGELIWGVAKKPSESLPPTLSSSSQPEWRVLNEGVKVHVNSNVVKEYLASFSTTSSTKPMEDTARRTKASANELRYERLSRQEVYYSPYHSSMLSNAKSFYALLISCERKLIDFVQDEKTNAKSTLNFDPMSSGKRTLLKEYVTRHFGLACVEMDPEPNRFLSVSFFPTSLPFIPKLTLSRAIVEFPDLMDLDDDLNRFGVGYNLNGIAFWNCTSYSGDLSKSFFSSLSTAFNVRESEIEIYFISLDFVIVNFSSVEKSRKIYKALEHSYSCGNVAWERLLYWPSSVNWAKLQNKTSVETLQDINKDMKEIKIRNKKKDAWSDEEEDQQVRVMMSAAAAAEKKNKLEMKTAPRKKNMFDALKNEQSDDDDDF